MKKTVVICDVTGQEGSTLPVSAKLGEERHSKLDAAGDTDEWYEPYKVELDLSHRGAVSLLESIITGVNQANDRLGIGSVALVRGIIERTTRHNGS